MNTTLSVLLELLKITVPSLIVFLTAYYILKEYLDKQYSFRMLEFKENQQKTTLPLRLQAYERLSMFCERIYLPNLILRLREEEMTAKELQITLMLAIQQEYEHNVTQQVYVSDHLWKIIKIARDTSVNIVNIVADSVEPTATSKEFMQAVFDYLQENDAPIIEKSLLAIKKEAGLVM